MGNPLLRWQSIVLAMLSLSIGWGIRGNFGHEFGAMMPGMLCAVAVCLFSGRGDWRARVPYFGLFGAFGWAFGGSMAYMPVISYTHSGHLLTQLYGFLVVFAVGFLWSSLGGAGTAYAAVESREKIERLFRPLVWVLAAWALWYLVESHLETGDARQRNLYYWFDSDWLPNLIALAALCLYDLWERRFRQIHRLVLYSAAGAAAGWLIQLLLTVTGWMQPLLGLLVHYQGDPAAIDPVNMVTNWPQFFFDLGGHLGWILGMAAGLAVYFYRHGAWRDGSALLVRMSCFGYLVFLAGPVLLSNACMSVGGFRMVAPRGDNWAFVLGYLIGVVSYMMKNNLRPVAYAALMSGVLGGLGFMVAQFLKLLALMPGNPVLTQNQATIQAWAHWRSANWHSILAEQGVGLLYGVAILLPMAMLVTRVPQASSEPRTRRWTEVFAVAFLLNVLVYVNLVKNVSDWTALRAGGFRSVPLSLKAPLAGFWEMSAVSWFSLMFALIALVTVALLAAHVRRPLALVPPTWLGKGQWFYLVFLWAIVIGNFERALVSFHEQRLATEGVIFVNALIATFFLLFYAREKESVPLQPQSDYTPIFRRCMLGGAAALAAGMLLFTAVERGVYGNTPDGWGGTHRRFGPDADWRTHPILKNQAHR